MGGAISIYNGLTCPHKLAGICGLSSWLLMNHTVKDWVKKDTANIETPIFLGHGDVDPLVQYKWGQETAQTLRSLGCNVDFRTYKGLAHSADPKEMDDLEEFLRARLPPSK